VKIKANTDTKNHRVNCSKPTQSRKKLSAYMKTVDICWFCLHVYMYIAIDR